MALKIWRKKDREKTWIFNTLQTILILFISSLILLHSLPQHPISYIYTSSISKPIFSWTNCRYIILQYTLFERKLEKFFNYFQFFKGIKRRLLSLFSHQNVLLLLTEISNTNLVKMHFFERWCKKQMWFLSLKIVPRCTHFPHSLCSHHQILFCQLEKAPDQSSLLRWGKYITSFPVRHRKILPPPSSPPRVSPRYSKLYSHWSSSSSKLHASI